MYSLKAGTNPISIQTITQSMGVRRNAPIKTYQAIPTSQVLFAFLFFVRWMKETTKWSCSSALEAQQRSPVKDTEAR